MNAKFHQLRHIPSCESICRQQNNFLTVIMLQIYVNCREVWFHVKWLAIVWFFMNWNLMIPPSCLQCFDAVGWVARRAPGLWKTESVARCRFAYGPADASATHCLLLQ